MFWYNTNSSYTSSARNTIINAINTRNEVKVYGVYQSDPKQAGKMNLFVHAVVIR